MSLITKKKNLPLHDVFVNAYKNLDIIALKKILKSTPTKVIIDALNQIEDIKTVIFSIVAFQDLKPLNLIQGLSYDYQEKVLSDASDTELKIVLKNLYPDDIFELITEHPLYAKRIYLCIDSERRKLIKKVSAYEDDEIGQIMNPKFMRLEEEWTVKQAINYIKDTIGTVETTNYVFVTNVNKQLNGAIKIYDLLFTKNTTQKVKAIMDRDYIAVDEQAEIEDVINMFDKYSIDILAVVDAQNTLVGIIKNSDIAAAIQDEATEDIYKMYGITELHTPYLHTSTWHIVRSRLLWLSILMISATMTSFVLEQFQVLSASLTQGISTIVLIPLLPVLTGTSGNAGSQSSASIIRSLSIGEITKREYWKAIFKEVRVGLLIGVMLAVINFVRLLIYYAAFTSEILKSIQEIPTIDTSNLTWGNLYANNIFVALSSSLTLFISIMIAKVLGACLPILATKCNIDPTVMSAPILATILDVTTTTTLFGIGIYVVHAVFSTVLI